MPIWFFGLIVSWCAGRYIFDKIVDFIMSNQNCEDKLYFILVGALGAAFFMLTIAVLDSLYQTKIRKFINHVRLRRGR